MSAPAGIKLDDGTGHNISKCFPARSLLGGSDDGAWLVSYRSEQKRRLKVVLATRGDKKFSNSKVKQEPQRQAEDQSRTDAVKPGLLDGFFLLKHCCIEDPSELCNVNIAGQRLTDAREEDFELFENVALVNAAENLLPFECFRGFVNLRELEIPLNGLRGLRISFEDFPSLQLLDMSYNNLSKDDILALGMLPKLRVLHLSGNHLRSLPTDMTKPHRVPTSASESSLLPRFALLEELSLDDNQLSDLTTFASLAGLRRLKKLNLSKNLIQAVPHLRAVSGRHIAVETRGSTARTPKHKRRVNSPLSGGAASQADDQEAERDEEDNLFETDLKISAEGEEPPPPFPELEYLNLANNEIAFEENLLAVAAWPMLVELDIYNNPLTVHNKGDPPLLKQYLVDRLGVQMRRKKTEETRTTAVHVAPHRKVEEVARPLPKQPHPALLLAERPAILAADPASQRCDPLPPIGSASDISKEEERNDDVKRPPANSTESGATQAQSDVANSEEPVFLTQVDDPGEEVPPDSGRGVPLGEVPPSATGNGDPDDQPIKGYELLCNNHDDSEVYVHNDIQSNLRSLKLALQHKPVFRSDVDLNTLKKPFNPHQKAVAEPRPPRKTRDEELEEVLVAMKNRVTVTEENLGRILADKERMREQFPEVPKLLKEIQTKYKCVRAESMQEKRQLAETQEELLRTANAIKPTLPPTSSS